MAMANWGWDRLVNAKPC